MHIATGARISFCESRSKDEFAALFPFLHNCFRNRNTCGPTCRQFSLLFLRLVAAVNDVRRPANLLRSVQGAYEARQGGRVAVCVQLLEATRMRDGNRCGTTAADRLPLPPSTGELRQSLHASSRETEREMIQKTRAMKLKEGKGKRKEEEMYFAESGESCASTAASATIPRVDGRGVFACTCNDKIDRILYMKKTSTPRGRSCLTGKALEERCDEGNSG